MQQIPQKRTQEVLSCNKENTSFVVYGAGQPPPGRTPPKAKRSRVDRAPYDPEANPFVQRTPLAATSATSNQSLFGQLSNRRHGSSIHPPTPASTSKADEYINAMLHEGKMDDESKLLKILASLQDVGWTVNDLIKMYVNSRNQQISGQASRMLTFHGAELLDVLVRKRPDIVDPWAFKRMSRVLKYEAKALCNILKPGEVNLAEALESFSLESLIGKVQASAPQLWNLLESMGESEKASERRKRELVYVTIAAMISQCRNERSNMFQQAMSFWLYAGGAGKDHFDVLHHAGLCSSYTKTIRDLESLSDEMLAKIRNTAKSKPVMIVWDNLNIAFKVAEQRLQSKAHFDNGTTATVIVLEDIELGSLQSDMIPNRMYRQVSVQFEAADILPSPETARELDAAHLYHIIEILFDAFPSLRKKFKDDNPVPVKSPIPVHKTEHYALPCMELDESSLDGTLDVIRTIIQDSLKLTEDDVKRQGVIICAGDQLTMSLLDKASASRRDDSDFLDNIGKYTEGQPGLFHAFMNATRMVGNEFWGIGSYGILRQAPWSLWKINSLLGRKNIASGWKSKQLAPFWPMQELILKIALPANILDAFRIYCPGNNLKNWEKSIKSFEEIRIIAKRVQHELVNRRRVYKLRRKADEDRDPTLENIILFNLDALTLREFQDAVRTGDIGRVLNVLTLWMLEFRGTGSMPKYADMLYRTLMRLKTMHPTLRKVFLHSWLVNITGKRGRFKAVDLLQEHQNFWAKIIYMAKGSNRSWRWLSMITLCIWALRDVIRNLRLQYKVRYNGTSHTSPSLDAEVEKLTTYLEETRIQSFWPARPFNSQTFPARDFVELGAEYFNTSGAAKSYYRDTRKASYKKTGARPANSMPAESESEEEHIDDGDEELWAKMGELSPEELAMDGEEYTDTEEFNLVVGLAKELLNNSNE